MPSTRKDRIGEHRTALEKNKKIIFQTQTICGICGQPVDMSLKYPDPMSKTVDHIIPVSKGGHPSELSNLQLAHRCCNRQKGAKLFLTGVSQDNKKTRDVRKTPGTLKDPGALKDPGTSNNPGISEDQTANGSRAFKITADNDNLPQHIDWMTYSWL